MRWIGKCDDCGFIVTGDKATVMDKSVEHELRNPGHWVEHKEVS